MVLGEIGAGDGAALRPEGRGSMGSGWSAVAVEAGRLGGRERRHFWQGWVLLGPG